MKEEIFKVGILSDTHSHIDDRILHHLQGVDEIWHAGDIGQLDVTDSLARIAPVRAVYGNIDCHLVRATFPEWQRIDVAGLSVHMVHIGGRPGRYAAGIRQHLSLERPDVFICGHSHLLRVERDESWGGLYINPGAAGLHGMHKTRTILSLEFSASKISQMKVVELGPRVRPIS